MTYFILSYQPPVFTHLDILYEDKYCIAINKPSGLLSVPGRGPDKQDCLYRRLLQSHPSSLVIHRLDMPTSGILLFALNKSFQRSMSQLFEARLVKKTYVAKVFGMLKPANGTITQPLLCDWNNRPKQKIDYAHGKPSVTNYKRLCFTDDGHSIVCLEPVTGRSHQLRVHMSSIGHPILGDNFYATPDSYMASNRLLLHSQQLSFCHPETGEMVNIECPAEFL